MATISYKYNPDLPIIKKGFKGNKFINGRYVNDPPRKTPSISKILRWQLEGNPQAKEKKQDKFSVPVINNPDLFRTTDNCIAWLGHASFFIRINGVSLLTDPCLGNIALLKRLVGLPCAVSDIVGLDYLLISHGHRDHFDRPSLKRILKHNPEVTFLAPLDLHPLIEKLPHPHYQTAGWYQQYSLKEANLKITFVPAIHWNKRGIRDYNDMLWGGFIIESLGTCIYFAGDTAYGNGQLFDDLSQLFDIDIAMLPIGAYKPAFLMKASHTNPQESVSLFNQLGAKTFIPMHYATYDLSDEPISEPIRTVQNLHKTGVLQGELQDLAVGERFMFGQKNYQPLKQTNHH